MAAFTSGTNTCACQGYDATGGCCACTRSCDNNTISNSDSDHYRSYSSADNYKEESIKKDFHIYYERNLIPIKLEFKSKAPNFIYKNFKQPIARSGFKRGQRNEQNP